MKESKMSAKYSAKVTKIIGWGRLGKYRVV